jgi:putative membrane protein
MKRLMLLSGLVALTFAWLVLPQMAQHLFSAHMTMHMLVVAVAAPLIALSMSGSSWDVSKSSPILFAAIPASVGELIIVWGWHAPALHRFARQEVLGLMLEQSSFFLAGLWVWLSCLNPDRRGAGIIGLLLTSMHMTLLGALLGLAPRPLYSHHHGSLNLSALDDQQLGGAIMLVVGGIVYMWGGVELGRQLLKEARSHSDSFSPMEHT